MSKDQTTIADLEQRVILLERLAAAQPHQNLAPMLGYKGCVCPAGAEATCRGFNCPRKEVRIG